MNINNIPLPTDVSETTIFQSAVFIEDGLRYRSIHHRIDPTSLKIYRIYYSKIVRCLLGFVIFVNLMLAFFEYPTSLSLSADKRYRRMTWHAPEPPCGVTESIELTCLVLFLLDCVVKFYLIGWRRFVRKPWLVLYFLMLILSFADLTVSVIFCKARDKPFPESLLYTLRLRRFCRPLFFLLSSTIMKKFVKAVTRSLPQIFSVLVLLVMHLYVFTLIGLICFPRPANNNYNNTSSGFDDNDTDPIPLNSSRNLSYSYFAELEGNQYFSSVSQAFMTLIILLTTANHPDVMMPIYQYNRFSSIYFILFLGIGTFLILNLLIAATYNQFKGFFQKSLQTSFFRRRVAFRAAFTLLAKRTYQIHQRRGSRVSYVQEVASKDLIRQLIQTAGIPKTKVPQMYPKLETMKHFMETENNNITSSQCLTWHQFCEVFDLISKEPVKRSRTRLPYYGRYIWLQWIQLVIRHRYFAYFTYTISIINVILITIELQISYDKSLERADSRLAYYNICFVLYYVLEQILKLIGLGCKGYFRALGNVYEGILTFTLVVLEVIIISFSEEEVKLDDSTSSVFHYDTVIRIINIVIVFRFLRIVAHVKSLRILIGIIIDLFRNLSGFAGLMIIAYYLFALLGMELFEDVDGFTNKPVSSTNNTSWADVCGTYDNLSYFANNFHDFASSLVTLWDIMVVNNWFVILDKFARDSALGGWSNLYFIAWWLIAAIIGMNLFVSLVLDTFLIKWEATGNPRVEEEVGLDNNHNRLSSSSNGSWEEGESILEENRVS